MLGYYTSPRDLFLTSTIKNSMIKIHKSLKLLLYRINVTISLSRVKFIFHFRHISITPLPHNFNNTWTFNLWQHTMLASPTTSRLALISFTHLRGRHTIQMLLRSKIQLIANAHNSLAPYLTCSALLAQCGNANADLPRQDCIWCKRLGSCLDFAKHDIDGIYEHIAEPRLHETGLKVSAVVIYVQNQL